MVFRIFKMMQDFYKECPKALMSKPRRTSKTNNKEVNTPDKEVKTPAHDDVESCATEPLYTDVVKKDLPPTIKIRRPRNKVEQKEDEDEKEVEDKKEDEDKEEDEDVDKEEDEVKVKKLKLTFDSKSKILVIGDQELYEYLVSKGFTNVVLRSSINMDDLKDIEVIFMNKE